MKLIRLILSMLVLLALAGCDVPIGTVGDLVLNLPATAYPGDTITIKAAGVGAGQFTFSVAGRTVQQSSDTLQVTIDVLPCVVLVSWTNGTKRREATATVLLENQGPVIGRLVLNFIYDLWTLQPRDRYHVTFPEAYDPEGGEFELIDVYVYHQGQGKEQAVFCPPYVGDGGADPSEHRVRLGQGDVLNSFIFFSIWPQVLDTETPGWKLPFAPPAQGLAGYPGVGVNCKPKWTKKEVPAGDTLVRVTFEDECGARTTEEFLIPTMYYPGC